jgi:hypothetical protein
MSSLGIAKVLLKSFSADWKPKLGFNRLPDVKTPSSYLIPYEDLATPIDSQTLPARFPNTAILSLPFVGVALLFGIRLRWQRL